MALRPDEFSGLVKFVGDRLPGRAVKGMALTAFGLLVELYIGDEHIMPWLNDGIECLAAAPIISGIWLACRECFRTHADTLWVGAPAQERKNVLF